MRDYKGLGYKGLDGKPDEIVGGGLKEHRKGLEVCNFLRCNDGYVYGHVETIKKDKDRQINIDNILPNASNSDAESVDGVDVIWIATNRDEGGRRVVGWYRNATVYRHRQAFDKAILTRQHKKDEIRSYRVRAKYENATLLRLEGRSDPALRLGRGEGWIGEANWWYPERQSDPAIKKFVRGLRAIIDGKGKTLRKESQENIARKKLNRDQWTRPEQQQFRKKILKNYNSKCAVTECVIEEALEAAHIHVLKGDEDGIRKDCNTANGILLRSDIHALFDAFLITLSENGKRIEASDKVLADPTYKFLRVAVVFQPKQEPPLAQNIGEHRKRYFAKDSDLLKG